MIYQNERYSLLDGLYFTPIRVCSTALLAVVSFGLKPAELRAVAQRADFPWTIRLLFLPQYLLQSVIFWRLSDRKISPHPQLVFSWINSLTWQNRMLQDHWAWYEESGGSTAPQEGLFLMAVAQDKTCCDVPLQLITVLLYYPKWTGEMSLNISELPSVFSPYFAHHVVLMFTSALILAIHQEFERCLK